MSLLDLTDKLQFSNGGVNLYFYIGDTLNHRVCVKTKDDFIKNVEYQHGGVQKLTLECSTVGDKRFSAFGAKVDIYNNNDLIEFHYQLSKRFDDVEPIPLNSDWEHKINYVKKIKGKTPTHFVVNGVDFDVKYLEQWYNLLWCKYLDKHKKYIEYLSLFDDFNDVFKGKSVACQADSIRLYIKEGRSTLLSESKEFIDILKGANSNG